MRTPRVTLRRSIAGTSKPDPSSKPKRAMPTPPWNPVRVMRASGGCPATERPTDWACAGRTGNNAGNARTSATTRVDGKRPPRCLTGRCDTATHNQPSSKHDTQTLKPLNGLPSSPWLADEMTTSESQNQVILAQLDPPIERPQFQGGARSLTRPILERLQIVRCSACAT